LTHRKASPTVRHRLFYGWYLVAAAWMMLFLTCAVAVGIFFKPMLEEFQWDRATLSSVQMVALILFSLVLPFLGRLIDRFGPRAMLFACVATQTLSSVINGVATSLWHLYIGRFLYGIQSMHATQVLINRWFVKKRGRALGIAATGAPLGTLILSPVSEYLVLNWGWRPTMLFWAGVTFVILLPLTLMVRDRPEDKGYLADGERLPATPLETSPEQEFAAPEGETGRSLAESLRLGSFWLLAGTQVICGIGCGFMMTHIVIFATDVGYSDMIGASLLSVQGGVNLLGVLLTGYFSDRYARSRVLSLTHLIRGLSFAATVVFLLLGGGSLWLLYIAMALFGFGWYTTAPLSSGLTADLFGYRRMGTILGLILSCHMIGMAVGAYAGGVVYVLTGSYFFFFVTQGALELLAAIFAFFIKRPARS
jgi:MFS family permease